MYVLIQNNVINNFSFRKYLYFFPLFDNDAPPPHFAFFIFLLFSWYTSSNSSYSSSNSGRSIPILLHSLLIHFSSLAFRSLSLLLFLYLLCVLWGSSSLPIMLSFLLHYNSNYFSISANFCGNRNRCSIKIFIHI